MIRDINVFTNNNIVYVNKIFLGVILMVNQRIRHVDILEVNVWAFAKNVVRA